MKRLLALILSLSLILSLGTAQIHANATEAESGVLALLNELNIMTGDPDGNLRLDDYVSRAEFTKIAVASSSYKNSVASNLAVSPFPDVTYKHWAAPYVRVGVTSGIVSGYPDATFKPEDTVLYEEAITMLLRVLGYTDDDFGAAWPSGQIGLADNLDMTDNISCTAGELMNRRQVAQLVYNTLKTKQKNSQSNLLALFDTTWYEDTTLIASHAEDNTLSSDEIFTTSGVFKANGAFNSSAIGMSGDVFVKDSGRLIAFVPDSTTASQEYIVYSVLADRVIAYKNGTLTQLKLNDDTDVYKGKSMTSYAALKSQLELGDCLNVRMTDFGDVDYMTYKKGNVAGPVTAYADNWKAAWNIGDSITVTRNGSSASAADIQNNDILYYLSDLNMVLAYTNKITGIYEKATPNRDVPTSVTISGKEYELEGSSAFNKLYSGGAFEYGDTVTVMLGRDNKIADVAAPAQASDGIVGYLTETGQKEYSGGDINTYTNYYIKIIQPDGTPYEFVTDKDYTESKNSVVELSFTNGYARVKRIASPTLTGTFDWDYKRLGSVKLSPNIQILDIGTKKTSDTALWCKVYGQRLDGIELSSKAVLYAEKNESNEIIRLILNNVTGDSFSYGIMTAAPGASQKTEYSYISEGYHYTLVTSSRFTNVSSGGGILIAGNPQNPNYLSPLNGLHNITSISSDRLTSGNTTYKISDKVSVYKKNSGYEQEYSMLSMDELIKNKSSYNISAYYDKPSDVGGRVRIIIATDK